MIRTILGLLAGMVLAFAGVFFFAWVLHWLWTRLSEGEEPAAIEIETQLAEPEVKAPVAEEGTGERAVEIELETKLESKAPEPPAEPDDLKRIEGIGPKLSSILSEAGIFTFAQLADANPDELTEILEAADPRLLHLAHPASWPEQAALAATGEWEALEALQRTLTRGRKA